MTTKVDIYCGGSSSEREISVLSAKYIQKQLEQCQGLDTQLIEIANGAIYELKRKADYIIPFFHGHPGETGEFQGMLNLLGIPYLGCGPEAAQLCFNKASTKLWLNDAQINNAPFHIFCSPKQIDGLKKDIQVWGDVYLKATHQGSSIGCYHLTRDNSDSEIEQKFNRAFELSPYVIVEKTIRGRELEIAIFQYQEQLHITNPGEIITPNGIYTYEEKYSAESQTKIEVEAKNLTEKIIDQIHYMAKVAFYRLKIKDMARIDFFLSEDNQVYLNEINTYPGHTEISMFPTMMENYGVKYSDYLQDRIDNR